MWDGDAGTIEQGCIRMVIAIRDTGPSQIPVNTAAIVD
jgi:hypothetical protein